MGKLIYLMNVSLDGYVETADGGIDWADIDEELHLWFNDRERQTEASLYGRRMYETMSAYWPTAEAAPDANEVTDAYARIWNAKPKIVFSSTLKTVDFNSRLVTGDVVDELAKIRAEFGGDLAVGGATLASAFIERGLVDEYQLVVHPVLFGGGKPFFPSLTQPVGLRLVETHQFASGVLNLGYSSN